MDLWQAVILGVVQGVTEFLPISSDGHLVLAQRLLGLQRAPVSFDIFLHAGTLLATVIFFQKQLRRLSLREWQAIAVANIPVAILGYTIRPHLESLALSSYIVAGSFFVTALFLWIADLIWFSKKEYPGSSLNVFWEDLVKLRNHFFPQHQSRVTFLQAFGVGLLQACALLPGLSRSGSTLLGGAVVGLSRERAFPFAFLIGLPAIFGAVVYDVLMLQTGEITTSLSLSHYIFGAIAAAVVGWFALKILSVFMQKSRLRWFALYCAFVSILSLFVV